MFGHRHRRLGPMFHQWNGTHQTNGVTTNFGVGGFSSAATAPAVPVAAVRENVLLVRSGLMHNFPRQAHSIGTTSGFATATHSASPMVNVHDSLCRPSVSQMHSRIYQVRSSRRPQTTFYSPSPAPKFAAHGYAFPGGHRHTG